MTGELSKQELKSPPGVFVPVYVTAKRRHAPMLLELRKAWPQIYFTARWPSVRDVASEQIKPAAHWLEDNAADALRSEVVIGFAEPEDDLNGSIWELGAAWRAGTPIFLVGENAGYKEWKFAKGIRRFHTMEAALEAVVDRIRYRETSEARILAAIASLRPPVAAERNGVIGEAEAKP